MNEPTPVLTWIPGRTAESTRAPRVAARPFPLRSEQPTAALIESVARRGLFAPLLVRPRGDELEIVCGWKRYRAALAAGVEWIPALVRAMDDLEAARCYFESKLTRRPIGVAAQEEAVRVLREARATGESNRRAAAESSAHESGPSRGVSLAGDIEVDRAFAQFAGRGSGPASGLAETGSSPALTEQRRRAQNLLRRTESLFEEALRRRALTPARVESIVDALIEMLDETPSATPGLILSAREGSDPTALHCLLVASLCSLFGRRRYAATDERLRDLILGGLLHDVGMVFVRRAAIVDDPGSGDPDRQFLKSHTRIGHAIVSATRAWNDSVAACARDHHERVDGSGYPDALRAVEISDEAQIVGLIDSYATLISPRAHRAPLSRLEALARLEAAARDGRFSPRYVQALKAVAEPEGHTETPPHPENLPEKRLEEPEDLVKLLT